MQCFIILIDGVKMERNRCLSGRITNNEGITLIVGRKIFCVSQTYTTVCRLRAFFKIRQVVFAKLGTQRKVRVESVRPPSY